jgi:crossover junction endodeoxyribonuclease RuvC
MNRVKILTPLQTTSKIILGIDPGIVLMGYGLIRITGKQVVLIDMGVLKLPVKKDNYERLRLIHLKVQELVMKHNPTEFAIEAPFFGKNVQSMLKLGRAQGVAIASAMNTGIPVTEYSPKKVKQSITGKGDADKEQVWQMLQRLIVIDEKILRQLDASDALAVALCHHFHNSSPVKLARPKAKIATRKKVNDWQKFILNNPGRIIKKVL